MPVSPPPASDQAGDSAPVGDLLDFLRRAYEGVGEEAKQSLLNSPSLVTAVHSTVHLAFPEQTVYLSKPDTRLDDPETRDAAHLIMWCLDDVAGFIDPYDPSRSRTGRRGVLGVIPVRSSLPTWRNGTPEDRDYLLYRALRDARVELHTIDDVLADRNQATQFYSRPTIATVAIMWCDTRMAEGYTPEAARTLLALRAGPDGDGDDWSVKSPGIC